MYFFPVIIHWRLGWSHILAVVTWATVWVCKQPSHLLIFFHFGKFPEERWWDHILNQFSLLRRSASLHSHQQWIGDLFPHILTRTYYFLSTDDSRSNWVIWNFVVFACFSLMASESEHFFMCLLAICVIILWKLQVHVFHPFVNWIFGYWWWWYSWVL